MLQQLIDQDVATELADRLATSLAELQRAVARSCPVVAPALVVEHGTEPGVTAQPSVARSVEWPPAVPAIDAAVLAGAALTHGKSRPAGLPA
jgi:hypothetical protein